MHWQVLSLLLVTMAVAKPPSSRTREEIEAYRKYLESCRMDFDYDDDNYYDVVPKKPLSSDTGKSRRSDRDILLDDFMVENMVGNFASNAHKWPDTKWPNNTVIWEFGDGEFNKEQKKAILKAIKEIEDRTCVKFALRKNETVYVKATGTEYRCNAHVGYWAPRGVHSIIIGRDPPGQYCFKHTSIIHEWFHILGFQHMHNTYNRDDYIAINWDNIQEGQEYNFDKFNRTAVDNLGLPYEYTSTMHYEAYAFSNNGSATIVALKKHKGVMGQDKYVTDMDYLRVNRHYNCSGAWDCI